MDLGNTENNPPNVEENNQRKKRKKVENKNNDNLHAEAWKFFDRRHVGVDKNGVSNYKAKCKFCHNDLDGKPSSGTSHLMRHHKKCGELILKEQEQKNMKQQILQSRSTKGKFDLSSFKFDQEASRNDLTTMIIVHEYPLSIVEHEWFRKFVNGLNPLFKMVSRNTVKRDCFKIYDVEKAVVMQMLDSLDSRIGLTTDMWTSSTQKKGFMAVTAHFIDANWKLQSRIISFIFVPSPHTAEALSEALMKVILDWNIDRKISTITVDNCSTNDAMLKLMQEKLPIDSLLLHGIHLQMRCCAHILNLIVKDGLEVIHTAVENVRNSVAYWGGTPKRNEKFTEAANQLKINSGKKLILDCKTRWNSTFMMLEVALEYKEVFSRLKMRGSAIGSANSDYKCLPSDDEWDRTRQVCEKLKLFYTATKLFSGTKYPTSNLYFAQICDIKVAIRDWCVSGVPLIEEMAKKMSDKFDVYWSQMHGIMGVASVLDPRFKSEMLLFYFTKIKAKEDDQYMVEFEVEKIIGLFRQLFQEYAKKEASTDIVTHGSGQNDDALMSSLNDFDAFVAGRKRKHPTKTELDYYLEDDIVPRVPGQHFDILAWWSSNKGKYPILHKLARDILAIPISSVASESAFSGSGRLISPHRSRLHPNTVEVLMCAQNWLLNKSKDDGSEENGGMTYGKIFEDSDDEEDVFGQDDE